MILILADETLTAFSVCLRILVQMLNTTRVEGAGTTQNTMNLKEKETEETEGRKFIPSFWL